jgi:2-polyprenyl-6-methoxyphenol hydroxylase-like FAD-dependent oxidoreductase
MSRTLSIAIAGAGIGGLAAAAFLARQGHRVTVFDQFDSAGPVGSGLMLQETGLVILDQLGLRGPAEALGAPIERLWGISAETRRAVLESGRNLHPFRGK